MRFTTTTILAAFALAIAGASPASAFDVGSSDPGGHGLGRSGVGTLTGIFGGPSRPAPTPSTANPGRVEAGTGRLAHNSAPSILGGAYGKTVTSRMQGKIKGELGPIPNPRPQLGKGLKTKVPGLNLNPQPPRPGVDSRLDKMGPSGNPDGIGRSLSSREAAGMCGSGC